MQKRRSILLSGVIFSIPCSTELSRRVCIIKRTPLYKRASARLRVSGGRCAGPLHSPDTWQHLAACTSWSMPLAGDEASGGVDARALSHFFFALGQVALQHLVHIEALARRIRRQAAAKEKALAEAGSEHTAGGQAPAPGACGLLWLCSLAGPLTSIMTGPP